MTYLTVDENGQISLDELRDAVCEDTILVSMMMVNNEIGAVEPIAEAAKIVKEKNPNTIIHVDAIQAYGKLPIVPKNMGIDLLSTSGHKIHGPKGIGFLYIRKGVKIRSFVHGGAQERKRRAGTENVPGIIGFGKAVQIAMDTMEERAQREGKLRDYLIERVMAEVPYTRVNGHRTNRLPNNVNLSLIHI